MKTIKVCLIGDESVGKTSLIHSWTLHTSFMKEMADVYTKRVNNDCEIMFYDIKGESLKVMNDRAKRSFIDGCQFVMLLYDISRVETFNSVAKRWFNDPALTIENCNYFIVGVKSDLINSRQVSIREAEDFSTRHELSFLEVSNVDYTNVDLLWRILLIRIQFLHRVTTVSTVYTEEIEIDHNLTLTEIIAEKDTNTDTASLQQQQQHPQKISYLDSNESISNIEVLASPISSPSSKSPDKNVRSLVQEEINTKQRQKPPRAKTNHIESIEDDSIRNFEFDKNSGSLIPVVNTDLRYKSRQQVSEATSSNINQREPDMYIDINVGDGRIGQIGVRSGDNVFDLAKKFVQKFNLDPSNVNQLAFLIRTNINKYTEKQVGRSSSIYSNTNMASSQNMEGSSLTRTQNTEQAVPILKLLVDLGHGKTGTIVVRKGDDIKQLAKNFANTFQLKKWKEDEIAEEIRHQLESLELSFSSKDNNGEPSAPGIYSSQSSRATRRDHEELFQFKNILQKSTESTLRSEPEESEAIRYLSPKDNINRNVLATEPSDILFNMEVEIKQGMKRTLTVKRNEKPVEMARSFAKKYNLNQKAEDRLVSLIEYHIRRFHERNELKRRK